MPDIHLVVRGKGLGTESVERFHERNGFERRPDDRPGVIRVW